MGSSRDKREKKKKREKKDKRRKRKHESESDSGGSTSNSSDDEARKRRRAEKLAKKVTRHLEAHGAKRAIAAYTDEENPFGDPTLGKRFVWGKKIEKQIAQGVDVKELTAKAEERRYRERMDEIEKVKRRREEREKEREDMARELEQIQRERALAEALQLEKKEEDFHLEQAKLGALQRIKSGRGRPIDPLITALWNVEDGPHPAAHPPNVVFQGLSTSALRNALDDIAAMREMDTKDPLHVEFWKALTVVAEAELAAAIKQGDADDPAALSVPPQGAREGGWHESIDADVAAMLLNKSYSELCTLEREIGEKLEDARLGLEVVAFDPEYWMAVLRRLTVAKATSRLSEIHRHLVLSKPMDYIRKEMGWDLEKEEVGAKKDNEPKAWEDLSDGEEPLVLAEEYSPRPLTPGQMGDGVMIISEEDDNRELERLRAQVRYEEAMRIHKAAAAGALAARPPSEADRVYKEMLAYDRDAGGGAGGQSNLFVKNLVSSYADGSSSKMMTAIEDGSSGDAPFGGEVSMDSTVYWWHDKYRPRKPKYLNRVHTGFDWNKYNKTHYDTDNPPPKIVQGYKFNLFYPDLIDKSKAPTFTIEKDPTSDDGTTCILRFHAGPPYEDVAFRILNKEWEYNHKRGFKCVFDKGILHLYFNFKRQGYRR